MNKENQDGFFDTDQVGEDGNQGAINDEHGEDVHPDGVHLEERGQSLDEVRNEQIKTKAASKMSAKKKKVLLITGGVLLAVIGMVAMNAIKSGHVAGSSPGGKSEVDLADVSDMKPRGSGVIDAPVVSVITSVPASSVPAPAMVASAVQAISQQSTPVVLSDGHDQAAASSVQGRHPIAAVAASNVAGAGGDEIALLKAENAKLKAESQQLQAEMAVAASKKPGNGIVRTIYKDRLVKSECARAATPAPHTVADVASPATPKLTLEPLLATAPSVPTPVASAVVAAAPTHITKCEFKGSLVNRAWLTCDGKLVSVKAGDMLPSPYLEVIKVNDGQSSGSVLTSNGVVE